MRTYGGTIVALGLQDWWASLSEDERRFIRECAGKQVDAMSCRAWTTQTPSAFLCGYSSWAIRAQHYDLAMRMLEEALTRSTNAVDTHFTYNQLINLCYRRRSESPSWLQRCIEYCKADIALFPEFKKAYIAAQRKALVHLTARPLNTPQERETYRQQTTGEMGFTLRVPSFERLAIIYEQQGLYQEAIGVCELARQYRLEDGTKGGFEGRLKRLRKKMTGGYRTGDVPEL